MKFGNVYWLEERGGSWHDKEANNKCVTCLYEYLFLIRTVFLSRKNNWMFVDLYREIELECHSRRG